MAYERHGYGTATIADGATIPHGLGRAPRLVNVTASVAGTVATATADATNLTVALKRYTYSLGALSLSSATGTQQVWWEAAV